MPSKKKKYNARFPAGRIKKIMQTDEEIGKVAQAVPIIISRTLELFVHSLLTKTMQITNAKHAKTLSPSHMKQCILSESRFDFLKDLVKAIPDVSGGDDEISTPPLTPASGIMNLSTGSAVVPRVPDLRCKREPSDNNKSNTKDCVQSINTDIKLKYEPSNSEHPPNFQISVPSTFCGQPNFYTEVNPINLSSSKNNNGDSNNQPQKSSNLNYCQVDEDYDT